MNADLELTRPYEPLPHFVLWLTVLFAAGAVFDGLGAAFSVLEVLAFPGLGAKETTEDPLEVLFLLGQGLSALGTVVVFLATAVLFLVWLKRTAENARALGARELSFTPGWCVGWYFIPFFNLVKPYQAMAELWRAADPAAGPEGWKELPLPGLLRVWWTVWLASNMLNQAALRMEFKHAPASPWVSAAGDLSGAVACGLALWVVRGLHARQEAKAAQRG